MNHAEDQPLHLRGCKDGIKDVTLRKVNVWLIHRLTSALMSCRRVEYFEDKVAFKEEG